ncbi:hypothetical protein SDRG_00814 [Saprolegnia diclina VS20]|uniref:PH domain-containing protein n=1 Tax=Saprolegnia diclina (strain VS20) TaxID=1156394 RepID=T0R6A6_SAPDV|nr:hypothetical protein SDRG_00814 [Saprolegnia diclina VS20]EQC41965.1 hypothetical protein SDRG_00814 [Saprolegnia diclina VS20]|eukprot:XP_008604534.1 hypothetical protein SDRG_00814 [Saprolegnia diclina VS20]
MATSAWLVQGRLLRRDRTFHTWKGRQIYMDKDALLFFNSRGVKRSENFRVSPTGGSPTAADITISLFESPKPHGFILRVRDDKIFLAAENEADRDKWVDALVAHWGAVLDKASVNISTDKTLWQQPRHCDAVATAKTFGPMIETLSAVQFPAKLRATGDVLLGVGPFVRRVRWNDEPILAVALYIDPTEARSLLAPFQDKPLQSLIDDQGFYAALMRSPVRKTLVFSCRKRLSRAGIVAALHDEVRPRIGAAVHELEQLVSFIDKSLRKGESMICTFLPSPGLLDFHFKGISHPCLAAPALSRALQGLFFDSNSVQVLAKRGLVERLPCLWGNNGSTVAAAVPRPSGDMAPIAEDDDDDDEADDEDDDDEDEDDEDDDDEGVAPEEDAHSVLAPRKGLPFGPLMDPDSSQLFPGSLGDGAVLLGTWSSANVAQVANYSVGLYVDPVQASAHLLRFKGLSFGSVAADPDFSVAFTTGAFRKRLAIVHATPVVLSSVCDLLTSLLVSAHLLDDTKSISDAFASLPPRLEAGELLLLNVHPDSSFSVSVGAGAIEASASNPALSKAAQTAVGTALQSLFYGYSTPDVEARARLMQRLPYLLDYAKADSVHTYHDEIAMLKENYDRLTPANRVKVGYVHVYNQRRKMMMRWSRRWCRLDGVVFSLFSRKDSVKPRDAFVISDCRIDDVSSQEDMRIELRKLSQICVLLRIALPSGDSWVLRVDSVYDGNEWLDVLRQAAAIVPEDVAVMPPLSLPRSRRREIAPDDSDDAATYDEPEDDDDEDDDDDASMPMPWRPDDDDEAVSDRARAGSLVTWVAADARNQLIVLLLSLVVYLASCDGSTYR